MIADKEAARIEHGGPRGSRQQERAVESPAVAATSSRPEAATRPDESRRSWLTRHGWWVALVVAVLAVLAWRATQGTSPGTDEFGPTQAVPVRAAIVTRGDLDLQSSYPGELVGEVADIASQVSGLLREVPVRIGDHVEKGQVLAVIDDVDLRSQMQEAKGQLGVADANQRKSVAESESAEADHRRASGLFEANLISEQEFDRVKAQLSTSRANVAAAQAQQAQASARLALLEEQLANSRVLAPFSGSVSARYVDRGALVQPGTAILRLAEDSSLRVQFRVPERDLGAVRPGVAFSASTVATRDRRFAGIVRRISGEVSRSDRTAVVEGDLSESDEILKPGMYAQVEVSLQEVRQALIVPDSAVLSRVGMDGVQSTGVFRVDAMADPSSVEEGAERESRVARWTEVTMIGATGGRAAIEGPVAEGDSVLTLGHADLRDGAAIRVVQTEALSSSDLSASLIATGAAP